MRGIVPGAAKRREHGLPDGFWGQIESPPMAGSGGHHAHREAGFSRLMTEATPVAPSTAEAAVATERLAAWVIGALTAIVIGGVAIVIYGPHGGHAGGSSWLPEINASLNATATILLSTGYVLIRRRRIGAHRACMSTYPELRRIVAEIGRAHV